MVDARDFIRPSKWRHSVDSNAIREIASVDPNTNGKNCRDVANGEIKDADYSLYPVKYQLRIEGVSLEDLASITRGKEIPRSKLRNSEAPYQTGVRGTKENGGHRKIYCLSISDIDDSGFLEITRDTLRFEGDDDDLTQMDVVPDNDCIQAGDLLLGKILDKDRRHQSQARVAVVEESDLEDKNHKPRNLIAGSNLFVFRPIGFSDIKSRKKLSYFIKAFLESDACRCQLELAAAGSALSSISINSLKGIKISDVKPEDFLERGKVYENQYKKLRLIRDGHKDQAIITRSMFDSASGRKGKKFSNAIRSLRRALPVGGGVTKKQEGESQKLDSFVLPKKALKNKARYAGPKLKPFEHFHRAETAKGDMIQLLSPGKKRNASTADVSVATNTMTMGESDVMNRIDQQKPRKSGRRPRKSGRRR